MKEKICGSRRNQLDTNMVCMFCGSEYYDYQKEYSAVKHTTCPKCRIEQPKNIFKAIIWYVQRTYI